jgi:hypothetical protein
MGKLGQKCGLYVTLRNRKNAKLAFISIENNYFREFSFPSSALFEVTYIN